jgi:hypothetical protein
MVKLHELPSTKVGMGKRLSPPPPKKISLTNADFFRAADYGLYELLQKRDKFVHSSISYNDKYPETLNRKQIDYLTNLFEEVHEYIDDNPLLDTSVHRITKSLRQKTTNLGKSYISHHLKLNSLDLPVALKETCKELIEFVLDLVETFSFIDGLITDIRKIPNRPADGELRVLVHEIILNYQKEKATDQLPWYPYVIKRLKEHPKSKSNLKLSVRQYGNYKVWLKRGTYYWYIQP